MTVLRNLVLSVAVGGAANVMAAAPGCVPDACSNAVSVSGVVCADFLKPSYNTTHIVPEALAAACNSDVASVSSACLCATSSAPPVPSTSLTYYPPTLTASTTPTSSVPASSSPSGSWPVTIPPYTTVYTTTSTVCSTLVHTVTSCGPEVQHCPAESTVVVTSTIPISTTVCPVTETITPTTWGPKPTNWVSVPTTTWAPGYNTTKLITSTIYSTHVYTKTGCPPEVEHYPAHSTTVATEVIPVSTTICPWTGVETPTAPIPVPPESWVTSTIYSTHVYTKTACPPEVKHCPAHSTAVTTEIVPVSTTVCPPAEATPTVGVPPVVPPVASTGVVPTHNGTIPTYVKPTIKPTTIVTPDKTLSTVIVVPTPGVVPPVVVPPAVETPGVVVPPAVETPSVVAPPAVETPPVAPPAETSAVQSVPPVAPEETPAGSSPAVITTAAPSGPSTVATAGGAVVKSSIFAVALPLLIAGLL